MQLQINSNGNGNKCRCKCKGLIKVDEIKDLFGILAIVNVGNI